MRAALSPLFLHHAHSRKPFLHVPAGGAVDHSGCNPLPPLPMLSLSATPAVIPLLGAGRGSRGNSAAVGFSLSVLQMGAALSVPAFVATRLMMEESVFLQQEGKDGIASGASLRSVALMRLFGGGCGGESEGGGGSVFYVPPPVIALDDEVRDGLPLAAACGLGDDGHSHAGRDAYDYPPPSGEGWALFGVGRPAMSSSRRAPPAESRSLGKLTPTLLRQLLSVD